MSPYHAEPSDNRKAQISKAARALLDTLPADGKPRRLKELGTLGAVPTILVRDLADELVSAGLAQRSGILLWRV